MDEPARCPVCGRGTLVDVAFDLNADGEVEQRADSREVDSYTCGHEVPGPSLASADPDRLSVERRSSEETVDPSPAEVPPSEDV
ncbi:MAG TPA: hypothetical protein VE032_04465 [Actinomycetota bacterium]|nr:hypothetical protein [Actinomycetota bacterium]